MDTLVCVIRLLILTALFYFFNSTMGIMPWTPSYILLRVYPFNLSFNSHSTAIFVFLWKKSTLMGDFGRFKCCCRLLCANGLLSSVTLKPRVKYDNINPGNRSSGSRRVFSCFLPPELCGPLQFHPVSFGIVLTSPFDLFFVSCLWRSAWSQYNAPYTNNLLNKSLI